MDTSEGYSQSTPSASSTTLSKAYTANGAAASQSTPPHRLASPSPHLNSATHRMLSCSCSRARVDVCGRATAGVMALALLGKAGGPAAGAYWQQRDWELGLAEALALTRRLSVTALRDMGHGSQAGGRVHRHGSGHGRYSSPGE
jgi:hypothetical protein